MGGPDRAAIARPALKAAGRLGRFAGVAAGVAAAFGAGLYALVRVGGHDAESYGNRLLGAPTPQECALARAVVRDFANKRSAEARRAAGASGEKLELLAYAWNSQGARAPPGADWRWCRGFGPYVRGLGLLRMGSGRWQGPSLYVSRIAAAGRSGPAWAWATFFPPQREDPRFDGWRRAEGARTWRVVFPASNQPPLWIEIARRDGGP